MSRIGKQPVSIPGGVTVDVAKNNTITVKGAKGELSFQADPDMTVTVEGDEVIVERPTDQKRHRSFHGLTRSLVANMVQGVSEGYTKELDVIGVGYRADATKMSGMDVLELALGFSHPIYFVPPEGIDIQAETIRGQNPRIKITGVDKQLVGQVAAKIRALRPPEPYKGKGIRYTDEFVRRKAGKTAAR
ncbi:50S ribosomal protein L6 [Rubricoccus marinus]|uniref:Large ribosomal subunit protein uL6 n=1 Tax=Rubricoccus marinus TaxID=716817 RepID=A0A259U1L9_9BACT|nr:50S ribosomal protein L6 [Rubricoccus marinus]OZC03714.1 50S ribosomal protein L6 [Rubricoccus marinus]